MTPTSLLALCRDRGIVLEPMDGKIRCRAKKGVLTPDIQHDITIYKAELLRLLENSPTAPLPIKRLSSPHGDIEINWDGRRLLRPLIGFDTETTMPAENDYAIQRLVLATACDGQRRIVLPPEQIATFLEAHADRTFVFYNIAYDFWVLHEHFKQQKETAALSQLWRLAAEGQLKDAMLLDQLLTIAATRETPKYRSLEDAASHYTGLHLDKEGNKKYREHYADILGVPLAAVEDRGWFDYAADDTLATLKVYEAQQREVEAVLQRHGSLKEDFAAQEQCWGPLTENIQVMAAIALDPPYRNGLNVDPTRQKEVREQLLAEIRRETEAVNALVQQGPYQQYMGNTPLYTLNKNGKFSRSTKKLQAILENLVVPELQSTLKAQLNIPRTEKSRNISTSRDHWEAYASAHPFLEHWLRIEENSKLLQFVEDTGTLIHPRYRILVSSGRTSCSGPNIQQLPRDGGIREMIIPPPGHVFLASDYETLELRTLAQICLDRFGESELAHVFEQGIDPHAHTAALLLQMPYNEFLALKASDEKRFRAERQKAKAINFGAPGGLGVAALVDYARQTYGVTFTMDEAEDLRSRLINDIYPEIGWYLDDNGMDALAWNFHCAVNDLWNTLSWDPSSIRENYVPGFYRRILRGETCNSQGIPYSESVLDNAWIRLQQAAINNPDLHTPILMRTGSQELLRACTSFPAITTTGRIRGQCGFTQVRNVPFQGLAADGAKLAVFELVRRGWHVAIFVHDEIVVSVPEGSDYEALSKQLVEIMCDQMQRVVPDVPITASEAIPMRGWSKNAKIVRDHRGKIIPWSPP